MFGGPGKSAGVSRGDQSGEKDQHISLPLFHYLSRALASGTPQKGKPECVTWSTSQEAGRCAAFLEGGVPKTDCTLAFCQLLAQAKGGSG